MSQLINKQSYALCLAAYLYSCYGSKDPLLNYPESDLPHDIIYNRPTSAKECLLSAQCIVNSTLRVYFEPVFRRIYREKCRSVQDFSSYLDSNKFDPIGENDVELSTPMKLLARFALATELVLYCFQKGCYGLSNYLPVYLHDVLREEEFKDIFTSLTRDEELKSLPSPGYEQLESYCEDLIGEENHPSLETFRQIGNAFRQRQRPVQKQPRPEPGVGEQVVRNCVCGENDCNKYLKEFIERCVEEYGSYRLCLPTGCCPRS